MVKGKSGAGVKLDAPERVAELVRAYGRCAPEADGAGPQEAFYVLMRDVKGECLECREIFVGGRKACPVEAGPLFRRAIVTGADAIIIAHVHPSGRVEPSPEDLRVTEWLASTGRLLGVEVLDHVIVGAGAHLSMRECGMMAAV